MTPRERELQRKRRRENPERTREQARRYSLKHADRLKEYSRRWRAENLDYAKKACREYKSTLIGQLRNCFSKIKQRCENPNATDYERYGGRGIRCNFKSSDEFVDYVVNTLKVDPRGLQIDRINNDGHYELGNIRFVTAKVNANNKRKMRRGKSK